MSSSEVVRPMSAKEALRQLHVSFGDPSWIELATAKTTQQQQRRVPKALAADLRRSQSATPVRRVPEKAVDWTEVRITRPGTRPRPRTSPETFRLPTSSTRRPSRSDTLAPCVPRRRRTGSLIALAEHLEKIDKVGPRTFSTSAPPVVFEEKIIAFPPKRRRRPSSRGFGFDDDDDDDPCCLLLSPESPKWRDRATRARERRAELEEEKLRKTRETLARPERRKEREASRRRQRRFLAAVVAARAAAFFRREHEDVNDREWTTAALGSNALGGVPILRAADEGADSAKAVLRFERGEGALLLVSSPGLSHTPPHTHQKDHHERRGSLRRRGSGAGLPSAKTLAIQRKRVERVERAVRIIRRWWFDRKVQRTLASANTWVPAVLRNFVRQGEDGHFRRKKDECLKRVRAFLAAVKRSGFNAVRRLVRSVKRCQATIRASSRCRAARVLLLERAFLREERAYRDLLVADRKRAEVAAVRRMYDDPIFGWRTAKLFDANERMRHFVTKDPKSKRLRAKLRALKRRQLLHQQQRGPAATTKGGSTIDTTQGQTNRLLCAEGGTTSSSPPPESPLLLLSPGGGEQQQQQQQRGGGGTCSEDRKDDDGDARLFAKDETPQICCKDDLFAEEDAEVEASAAGPAARDSLDDADKSILSPSPAAMRRLACDAILTNQRRLFLADADATRRHTSSVDANIEDVRLLFFGDGGLDKCAMCVASKRTYQPFLLLTPKGGGLDEIRDFLRTGALHHPGFSLRR